MKDSDRKPVLAHERFLANKQSFEGLSLSERFDRVERINLWGAKTSVSGLGSEADSVGTVQDELPRLLARLGIKTILDAPCGDAGWIEGAITGFNYIGVDIVPSLIERNNKRTDGNTSLTFLVADITRDPLPRSDLVLCRDCFVHLSFANIALGVENMLRSGATWLLTTTFPLFHANLDCQDGDWRALNFRESPFYWPEPVELINEDCTEGNGSWSDKSLGLWRLSDLQVTVSNQTDPLAAK